MRLLAFLSGMLLFYPLLGVCEQGVPAKYHGPSCILGLCIEEKVFHEVDAANMFGEGCVYDGVDKFICYQLPDKTYVTFGINKNQGNIITSIFLSETPSCKSSIIARETPNQISTGEGIKIGDSIGKVMEVYGNPDRVDRGTGLNMIGIDYKKAISSSPFGEKVLVYLSPNDGLFHSEIYFEKEKVSAIFVSNSP